MADPKFLVLSCSDQNKKISDFSCFAVHKAIQIISKEVISISELRDGNLLLLVKDKKIAQKFLSTTQLHGVCRVTFSLHSSLNTTKGTIYAPYLNKVPDEEIVSELSSQGVTSIYKFNKMVDGKPTPSGVILLSFDSYNLPTKIDVSWHSVKVREYIPNPMRCKMCQLLGHTTKWCKNQPICVGCSLPPHQPDDCTRIMCANCSEQHPSSSNECKKFKQAKDILAIKTKNKCSMMEARNIYRTQITTPPVISSSSYATVLSFTKPPLTTTTQSTSTPKPVLNKENNNLQSSKNQQANSQSTAFSLAETKRAHFTGTSTSKSIGNKNNNIKTVNNNQTGSPNPNVSNDRTPTFASNSVANQQHSEESFSLKKSKNINDTAPSDIDHYFSSSSLNNNKTISDNSFTNNVFSPLPSINKVLSLTQLSNMSDFSDK